MNSSAIARELLLELWEYGRIVLIGGVAALIWGLIAARYEDENERSSFLLGQAWIVVVVIGILTLFSFLNTQLDNLVALMRAEPAWGVFTAIVVSLLILYGVIAGYTLLAKKRKESPVSIIDTQHNYQAPGSFSSKVILTLLLLLLVVSVLWLRQMATK